MKPEHARIIKKVGVALFASVLTIISCFLVHNPHIPNFVEQWGRSDAGLVSLVDPNDPSVVITANEIMGNDITNIEYYVYNKYPYKSDYDTWWNSDFWTKPYEMDEKGGGDCEDRSVYLSSLIIRLTALGYLEVHEVEMVQQPTHIYLNVDNRSIGYLPPEELVTWWDIADSDMRSLPWWRTILLGIVWGIIWTSAFVYIRIS